MARETTIHCPSGLTLDIRKLKLRELDILADVQAHRTASAFNQILSAIVTGTVDPGPYRVDDDGRLDWLDVLQGDRYVMLLGARRHTHGDDYEFQVQCANELCRRHNTVAVNLSSLPVKALAPEDLEAFKAGNRFRFELPGGPSGVFRLPTGRTEADILKRKAEMRGKMATFSMLLRIVEVDGVGAQTRRLEEWLRDLDADEADTLLAEMEAHDCGVETGVEVECQHCGTFDKVDLPFGRTFWSPRASRMKGAGQVEQQKDDGGDAK